MGYGIKGLRMNLANHQIIDFYGCDKDVLSNSDIVKSYFVKAAELSHFKAKKVNSKSIKRGKHGRTYIRK